MPLPEIVVRLMAIERAMWDRDYDALDAIAPCRCCCDDHTFASCLTRLWGGCRGGLPWGEVEP